MIDFTFIIRLNSLIMIFDEMEHVMGSAVKTNFDVHHNDESVTIQNSPTLASFSEILENILTGCPRQQ